MYEDSCTDFQYESLYIESSYEEWSNFDNSYIFAQCALSSDEIFVQEVLCEEECEEQDPVGQKIPASERQCYVTSDYSYEIVCDAKNFVLEPHYRAPGLNDRKLFKLHLQGALAKLHMLLEL